MSKKMKSNLLLLLTAFIWGSAFVAQKSGMEYIEPFTYNGIRTFIGGLVLIPVILILSRNRQQGNQAGSGAGGVKQSSGGQVGVGQAVGQATGGQVGEVDSVGTASSVSGSVTAEKSTAAARRMTVIGGVCCGLALFVASSLQQFGINYTTAGKTAFITTLYVMMVPILGLFLGKKVKPVMWLCVAMGVVGLYLLCMTDASFRLQMGDMLVLLCAVVFAVHILIIDYFSPKADGITMSCIQFLTAGALGIVCMFLFEKPDLGAILQCAVPILYAGVLSCGVGYTLQVVAQKDAEPTAASLILSLESVFGVLGGVVLLHETMSLRAILGCVIIFAAVVIAQLPSKEERAAQGGEAGQKK